MAWSYRIGTLWGISLKVHATFPLLLLVVAANWSPLGLPGIAFGALLTVLLFVCIAAHEFGHARAAQWFGLPVWEVALSPLGGIARLGRLPRQALPELVIAAAGPLVSVGIVAVLLPALAWSGGEPLAVRPARLSPSSQTTLTVTEAIRWLVNANIGVVLFNLIPAFPLDGGRILRGLLGLGLDWRRATWWATSVGQVLAVAMGAFAVATGALMLLLIAVLIFVAAEAAYAEERSRDDSGRTASAMRVWPPVRASRLTGATTAASAEPCASRRTIHPPSAAPQSVRG